MQARLRKLWDSLRSSYWFVPSAMMVLSALLWLATNAIDEQLSKNDSSLAAWLYFDSRDSIRSLLLTIAASTIGIVGVVFSILMVPLTIAASQFGPRLLRSFLRDTGTQITLGTFTSTFLFCILVILKLREESQIPQLSVSVGLLLGIASFGILIFFINHVAVSLQATVVVAKVSHELHAAIDRELPNSIQRENISSPGAAKELELQNLSSEPLKVIARASGYVQVYDDEGLLKFAHDHDLVIKILNQPGDFVTEHTTLAFVWPRNNVPGKTDDVINAAFILGAQRSLVQDVSFGINSLVEVGVRALSPGINDPITATTCLDWLGTALCRTCSRIFPKTHHYDKKGNLRLIINPISFSVLADAAFNPIREYGRNSTMVMLRMLDTIATIAQCVRTEEQRNSLLHHATLVEQSCHIGIPEKADREVITKRYQNVLQLLETDKKKPGYI